MFQMKMGKKTSRFQFRYCENNIEKTSTLFQNASPSFENSSKTTPYFSVTLSHTIESITMAL